MGTANRYRFSFRSGENVLKSTVAQVYGYTINQKNCMIHKLHLRKAAIKKVNTGALGRICLAHISLVHDKCSKMLLFK